MKEIIESCRENIAKERSKIGLLAKVLDRIRPPKWLDTKEDARFNAQYKDQHLLIKYGHVGWGCIVQANTKLFEIGPSDHPAFVIFSLDPHFDNNLAELHEIGSRLFNQKGLDVAEPELEEFSRLITDEFEAAYNLKVPHAYTNGHDAYCTSIMVVRKHLPNNILSMGCFPFLSLPEKTIASMITPSHYWPSEYVQRWIENEEGEE